MRVAPSDLKTWVRGPLISARGPGWEEGWKSPGFNLPILQVRKVSPRLGSQGLSQMLPKELTYTERGTSRQALMSKSKRASGSSHPNEPSRACPCCVRGHREVTGELPYSWAGPESNFPAIVPSPWLALSLQEAPGFFFFVSWIPQK